MHPSPSICNKQRRSGQRTRTPPQMLTDSSIYFCQLAGGLIRDHVMSRVIRVCPRFDSLLSADCPARWCGRLPAASPGGFPLPKPGSCIGDGAGTCRRTPLRHTPSRAFQVNDNDPRNPPPLGRLSIPLLLFVFLLIALLISRRRKDMAPRFRGSQLEIEFPRFLSPADPLLQGCNQPAPPPSKSQSRTGIRSSSRPPRLDATSSSRLAHTMAVTRAGLTRLCRLLQSAVAKRRGDTALNGFRSPRPLPHAIQKRRGTAFPAAVQASPQLRQPPKTWLRNLVNRSSP